MSSFDLRSDFRPTGDQPKAIEQLVAGVNKGDKYQTLLGATGTGKTFTMANVIAQVDRPTLVLAHNKTLAAQLASEFREFFPNNSVEYFVSYYDYYQPEAYVPQHDLYIEKDAQINQEIDRLRLAATKALLTRKDVIIVASVSCIYSIGSPKAYESSTVILEVGEEYKLADILSKLGSLQYERNDIDFSRGTFRVKGDVLDIFPAYEQLALRFSFLGNKLEKISEFDTITGENKFTFKETTIFPARHYMMDRQSLLAPLKDIEKEMRARVEEFKHLERLIEAQRIEERTKYDLEMISQLGYCSGIENYSRYFDGRKPGEAPYTLLDYFPKDFLLFVDESHITLPQVRGMWAGDRARKESLINFGFRLPSAIDNRPLKYEEFLRKLNQVMFVSATPNEYEISLSSQVVEQIIRPTGLLDPQIEVRATQGQIADLISEINSRVAVGERVLVTTLTKRMAEDLSSYLTEEGIKVMYLHSDIDTLERVEILRDLRLGVYDVVVGINLLREGLDLPEVSLVAILDADKEGFLRSRTSLIQTTGRAARHINGRVLMYADKVTDSMKAAIDETNRRRETQLAYNNEHGITPTSIKKALKDIGDRLKELQPLAETVEELDIPSLPRESVHKLIKSLEKEMKAAAETLDFEKASLIRDQLVDLKKELIRLDQENKFHLPENKKTSQLD